MTDDGDRQADVITLWKRWTREQGLADAPDPDLQPVTATIRSLPASVQGAIYLPSVGSDVPMTEEETREALRRFIASGGPLLCGDRQFISLIQHIDRGGGTKEATYEQSPFRYPLRGGFGRMTVTFAPDRRVLQVTSTCIPEADTLQRNVAGIGLQPMPFGKAAETASGATVTYADVNNTPQTVTLPTAEGINVRQLVIYPIAKPGDDTTLEFHLAWEIDVQTSPAMTVYLDAITGEIFKATPR